MEHMEPDNAGTNHEANPDDKDLDAASQSSFDAEFDDLFAKLGEEGVAHDPAYSDFDAENLDEPIPSSQLTERRATACYLTPISCAEALAALCSMNEISAVVVPTEVGSMVVQHMELAEEQWGMALLAESLSDLDEDLDTVASKLSKVTNGPVLVLSALLAPGTEMEPGVTGQVLAGRWTDGHFDIDMPAGMIVATMPRIIEDLVLGRTNIDTVPNAVDTEGISNWRALRMLGKGIRQNRRENRRNRDAR